MLIKQWNHSFNLKLQCCHIKFMTTNPQDNQSCLYFYCAELHIACWVSHVENIPCDSGTKGTGCWCYHRGEAFKHCKDHILWLLQCFQYHPASTFEGQAWTHWCRWYLTYWILDYLTSRPQHVRSKNRLRHDGLQHSCPSGNGLGCSPSILQASCTALTAATCRSSPMTLPSLGIRLVKDYGDRSTENWHRTLWTGACGASSC